MLFWTSFFSAVNSQELETLEVWRQIEQLQALEQQLNSKGTSTFDDSSIDVQDIWKPDTRDHNDANCRTGQAFREPWRVSARMSRTWRTSSRF